ncbi:MAG: hypothetical protein IKM54_03450, partial [Butyricicoccus sp.]|nr:hypothetical protein [Butyricicoccus sp.]
VPQDELIRLLWGDDSRDNPLGALKTSLHRVRTILNGLGSSGHDLILRRGDGYGWNPEIPISLDVERFDRLIRQAEAAADEDDALQLSLDALAVYGGDFLPRHSSENWVLPISAYYHNLYLELLLHTLPILEARGRFRETAELCRAAIAVDPYQEPVYQHLMHALLQMDDRKGAATVFEEMSELLLADFGVMPSDESRALYRQAVQAERMQTIPSGMLLNCLREEAPSRGALLCDFDFFRTIYQSKARAIERSGEAAHIGLISITGEDGKDLPRRSLDRAMENLQEQVRFNLRRGDVVSQCSMTQFVILLAGANFENSCMVCERIVKAFCRQYPHSPANLHYTVQPVEPI